MRDCLNCGKPLPRRKERGHREREYCSGLCRQRAWRKRNRDKHNIDYIMEKAQERVWNSVYQDTHRESWQDELERAQDKLHHERKEVAYLIEENTRMSVLLEGPTRRRKCE